MNDMFSKIRHTAEFLKKKGFLKPEVGIVLGTGLNDLTGSIKDPLKVAYSDIPDFPESTVESHKGVLIYGHIGSKRVVAMQGRFHYYEGYSMQQITFPVRVMAELGVHTLLLSNAAGGISPQYQKGDLVAIQDHINLLPENPLRGLNGPEWGNRFIDMSAPYDPTLMALIETVGTRIQIPVKQGVYAEVPGPNLETRAEYRYLRSIGADLVGMSTVPEVLVAHHVGVKCAAISVVTDLCDPDHLKPVNIEEIIEIARSADKKLSSLITGLIDIL